MLVQNGRGLMQMRAMLDTTDSIANSFHEEYLLHFGKNTIKTFFVKFSSKNVRTIPGSSLSLIMLENFQTSFDKTLINSPDQITK